MKKKLSMTLSLIILLIIVIVIIVTRNHDTNGGKEALTAFDVNSNQVTLSYNTSTITLEGAEQKDFISTIKKIYKENLPAAKHNVNYDIYIDFNNGNTAKISTDNQVILFQGIMNSISDNIMEEILNYMQ